MNPFRARKKSHDGGEPLHQQRADTPDLPVRPPVALRNRTFRRNKKVKPEPKVEVDLTMVLPSSDDFRTSLLMPNLSARFSMLREQDDPNSKLGKANDDSVLSPKRASRLFLFAEEGLTDIAEVASIAGSIRPPFAYGRSDSQASMDGYGTDDDASTSGGVMGRSKPGQGNKFFGGRQKVYKIPVIESTQSIETRKNTPNGEDKGWKAKAVYDDDIVMSQFQLLREEERAKMGESPPALDSQSERSSRDNDRPRSPPYGDYSRKRETTSSTTSGPSNARISTAATSVASRSASSLHQTPSVKTVNSTNAQSSTKQSPVKQSAETLERTATKNKRLYGQGLDRQMYEQQTSTMHRLDSIQRQRAPGGIPLAKSLSKARSATNMNDRFQRSGPLYASTSFCAGSPPPSNTATPTDMSGFDLGFNDPPPIIANRDDQPGFGRSPPLSPPMSPCFDNPTFVSSLEPNDLGKATASGAFQKPIHQYDEQQYAQRQLQLQEERETVSTTASRCASRSETPADYVGRMRNDSFASVQSSLDSSIDHQSQQFRSHALGAVPESPPVHRKPRNDENLNTNQSFLNGMSGSDGETEDEPRGQSAAPNAATFQSIAQAAHDATTSTQYEHDNLHPAFQNRNNDEPYIDLSEEQELKVVKQNIQSNIIVTVLEAPDISQQVDSPTLGPMTGLSGLVRAHFRNDSDHSSVCPSPRLNEEHSNNMQRVDKGVENGEEKQPAGGLLNDSWEVEQPNGGQDRLGSKAANNQISGPSILSARARAILDQATALRNGSPKAQQTLGSIPADEAQQVLGQEAPRSSQELVNTGWQDHVKGHHARGGSTETQKEREEFANELADRRKRVQDSLKNFAETESRSSSPMPGSRPQDSGFVKTGGAFGLLKKASRGSLVGKHENPSKAMKMLGIGSNSNSKAGSPLLPQENPLDERDEQTVLNTHGNGRVHYQRTTGHNQTNRPHPNRPTPNPGTYFERHNGDQRQGFTPRKVTPPFSRPFGRDRTDSEPSAHPYPNSNDHPLRKKPSMQPRAQEGFHTNQPPNRQYSPPSRSHMEARPPPDHLPPRSQSAMSGRIRSNSKGASPGYFDQKALLPIQTNYHNHYPGPIGRSPRASPVAPQSSQATSPYSIASPALSTASAPVMIPASSFPSTTRVPGARKRSINKHDISDPRFMSCTSSVTTVNLPPGASLSNGMDDVDNNTVPPIPPLNPRRRRTTTTQNVLNTLSGGSRTETPPPMPSMPVMNPMSSPTSHGYGHGERSTFSADESDPRPKNRHRLRKTSSEGGNLAARARAHAVMNPEPALPSPRKIYGPLSVTMEIKDKASRRVR